MLRNIRSQRLFVDTIRLNFMNIMHYVVIYTLTLLPLLGFSVSCPFVTETIILNVGSPQAPVITPDGKHALILDTRSTTLTVINLSTFYPYTISIPGLNPLSLAIAPNSQYAIVISSAGDNANVSILDINTLLITQAFTVTSTCSQPTITPNGQYAVLPGTSDNVYIADLSTFTATLVTTGAISLLPAVTPDSKYAVVSNASTPSFSIIDMNTFNVFTDTNITGRPNPATITPDGQYAIVTTSAGNAYIIDMHTFAIDTISVETNPTAAAVTPNSQYAIISNTDSGSVSIIDLKNEFAVTTVTVGTSPQLPIISSNGQYAVISNTDSYEISIIDLVNAFAVTTVALDDPPSLAAITPNDQYALISNRTAGDGYVSIIELNTSTLICTIRVSRDPEIPAIILNGQYALVSNTGSRTISMIDTTSLLDNLHTSSGNYQSLLQKIVVNTLQWPNSPLAFTPNTYLISRASNNGEQTDNFYVPANKITQVNGNFVYQDHYHTLHHTQYDYVVTAYSNSGESQQMGVGSITTP